MADWQKTSKAFLVADGGIDKREVEVLRGGELPIDQRESLRDDRVAVRLPAPQPLLEDDETRRQEEDQDDHDEVRHDARRRCGDCGELLEIWHPVAIWDFNRLVVLAAPGYGGGVAGVAVGHGHDMGWHFVTIVEMLMDLIVVEELAAVVVIRCGHFI